MKPGYIIETNDAKSLNENFPIIGVFNFHYDNSYRAHETNELFLVGTLAACTTAIFTNIKPKPCKQPQ